MRRVHLPLFAALSLGCAPPPEAPAELEQLCNYVFTHFDDEDPEALVAGLDNLDAWLSKGDNLASTIEGYQIDNLTAEAVEPIDTSSKKVTGLVGAAVANQHEHGLRPMAKASVVDPWGEVIKANFDVYERNYYRDERCFPSRDCLRLGATSYGESKFAGLIKVTSRNRIQFRWVETDLGWVMLHRSWLTEPADASLESIEIHAQYFMALTLPDGDDTVRVQATWIDADYGPLPISEDGAKREIVRSMSKQGEALEEWLDSQ